MMVRAFVIFLENCHTDLFTANAVHYLCVILNLIQDLNTVCVVRFRIEFRMYYIEHLLTNIAFIHKIHRKNIIHKTQEENYD